MIEIVTGLSEVYDDRGVAIWLRSEQVWNLSGVNWRMSALSAVANGHADLVMQKVDQLQSGAFS